MATSDKFMPGSDALPEEIFTYPFFIEKDSNEFIRNHNKIMFIIRGPPGTAKGSLTQLMMQHFPNSVKCRADDYFTNTFNSRVRTRESLKESHFYCHRRVKQECMKNSHPVVVSNTHMAKREMQEYLNLAAEFEYTVIVVSTLDKFKVSPKILAKCNTKGLSKQYFENRMKAWQDVFPILMGWFLCPDDSSYVLYQLQSALDTLLGDGKFCRVFNVFDADTLLNNYKAKTLLYCIAGFMKSNLFEFEEYYKSAEVRESYGKCFTISIPAFVVTKSNIFATVQLNDNLQNLTFKRNFVNVSHTGKDDDIDNVIDSLQTMSLSSSYKFKLTPLKNEFSKKPQTALLEENSTNHVNINKSSFIHLAQGEKKILSMYEMNQLFRKLFVGAINENGELSADQFHEVEGGYVIYRLDNDAWMIQLPKILSVKTVFTGLYI